MDKIITWFKTQVVNFTFPRQLPKHVEFIDIIQILIIAYFVYHLILWVKNTRAYLLLRGVVFIAVFILIANFFEMDVIIEIFKMVSVAAITAVVIVFQPELRRVQEQLGDRNFFDSFMILGAGNEEDNLRFNDQTLNELVRASFDMGEVKTGALIVIEQNISLADYEKTGIPVDAVLTGQLLINIFEHNTPLHDGAVIVRGNRVAAATCYLPLSDSLAISKELGTRHRAAIGISEVSDSLTIIVSEETGHVSLALNGEIRTAISASDLREQLHKIQKMSKQQQKTRFQRWKGRVRHEKTTEK